MEFATSFNLVSLSLSPSFSLSLTLSVYLFVFSFITSFFLTFSYINLLGKHTVTLFSSTHFYMILPFLLSSKSTSSPSSSSSITLLPISVWYSPSFSPPTQLPLPPPPPPPPSLFYLFPCDAPLPSLLKLNSFSFLILRLLLHHHFVPFSPSTCRYSLLTCSRRLITHTCKWPAKVFLGAGNLNTSLLLITYLPDTHTHAHTHAHTHTHTLTPAHQ